jgi:hypothetical protein
VYEKIWDAPARCHVRLARALLALDAAAAEAETLLCLNQIRQRIVKGML